jgi:hypothetical protein
MSEPDPQRERKLADLSLHDRLLHGIGRVAQAQVDVEITLRILYVQLTLPSPGAYLVGNRRSIRQLVEDCRVMLANTELPEYVKTAGRAALDDTLAADELRNRVVHDRWLRDTDDPSGMAYQRQRIAKGTIGFKGEASDLGYVDKAEESLRRVQIRIQALYMLATNLMLLPAEVAAQPLLGEQELREIRGEFDLLPNGGYRMRGTGATP